MARHPKNGIRRMTRAENLAAVKALHAKRRAEGVCIYGDGLPILSSGRCEAHYAKMMESSRRMRALRKQQREQAKQT